MENYRQILADIAGPNSERKFHARVGGELIRLDPKTEDDHRVISKFIIQQKIEGFILPMGTIRLLKIVIRGLPSDIPVEDIKNELCNLGFPVIKVAQLIKRKTQLSMPLFQIQLTPNDAAKNI